LILRAVLFDLFETLVTESETRPAGVSSRAAALGCEREAFRTHWKGVRPAVLSGRVSFCQALRDIATGLGSDPDDAILQRIRDERILVKAEPFAGVEPEVLMMLDRLRSRNLRVGIISNCFVEDIVAWPRCSLSSRVDCTLFSCEAGLAKPDPAIYVEAARRLDVDVSEAWFIGDGADDELSGAGRAGLRAFKALWFLRRWPHFSEEPRSISSVSTIDEFVSIVESTRL
jgi:FMN phosphatase YigB (HAD superfamily)